MIHYHGTPITPQRALYELSGRHFCVSFAKPQDIRICHEIGQSVMLDNGAWSMHTRGVEPDWSAYTDWCDRWLAYRANWCVIPDVIGGSEEENDSLLESWPLSPIQSAPVWHVNESLDRLVRLCTSWLRVCIGSAGEYATIGTDRWHRRMHEAMNRVCGDGPAPCWLHMLRGMSLSGSHYPFASVDSTDIGRNHNRPQNTPLGMAQHWDGRQNKAVWTKQPEQILCV